MGGVLSSFYAKPESLGYTRIAAAGNGKIEVRLYEAHWAARTTFSHGWRNQAFSRLAGYIGVFRKRADIQNVHGKRIPMTVPVLISRGQDQEKEMEFVILGSYNKDKHPPAPKSKEVQVAWVQQEMYAVVRAVDLDDNWAPGQDFSHLDPLLGSIEYEVDTARRCKTAVHDMPIFWHLPSTTEIWVPVREKEPSQRVCRSCGQRVR